MYWKCNVYYHSIYQSPGDKWGFELSPFDTDNNEISLPSNLQSYRSSTGIAYFKASPEM